MELKDLHMSESNNQNKNINLYEKQKESNRYEFVGCIASDKIRKKYKYKTISDYRSYGNPIKYLNV